MTLMVTKQNPSIAHLVEQCKREVEKQFADGQTRVAIEISMKDGCKWHYRCKATSRKAALKEILTVIKTLELATGEKVIWRVCGESRFYFSTNYEEPKLSNRLKNWFEKFFFYEEEEEKEDK